MYTYFNLLTDVTGAEALLERHQEHRTEIDARAGTFQAFELFGQQLLQANHFASIEVQEKLESMNDAREDLEKSWIGRRLQLDQCLQLQLFHRDCEQAENWMSSREGNVVVVQFDMTNFFNSIILIFTNFLFLKQHFSNLMKLMEKEGIT